MENRKAPVFVMSIIAIIVGSALYKQIDFKTMTVEKPWLTALYALTFLFALYILIKGYRKKTNN